jgi:hypothetical protein
MDPGASAQLFRRIPLRQRHADSPPLSSRCTRTSGRDLNTISQSRPRRKEIQNSGASGFAMVANATAAAMALSASEIS